MIWFKLLQNSVKVESLKMSYIFQVMVKNLFTIAYYSLTSKKYSEPHTTYNCDVWNKIIPY